MPYSLFRFLLCSGLGCVLASAQNLPTKLQECEGNQCAPGGGGGAVWVFNGKQGEAHWRYGALAKLTIERFDFDGLTILRTDTGGTSPGLSATYTGKITGTRIEGNVTWTWPGHWNKSPSGTWYATVVEPANYTFLNPSVPCPPLSSLAFAGSGAEAAARGAQAMEAKNHDAAACWFRVGADKGDATAQGILAAIYYMGSGVAVDYPKALFWAKKAADQGDYLGQIALAGMFAEGNAGVPKDLKQAEYWRAKAEQTRSATILARQKAQEQQLQAQRAQAQASAQQVKSAIGMLGLLLLLSDQSSSSSSDRNWIESGRRQEERDARMAATACRAGTGPCN